VSKDWLVEYSLLDDLDELDSGELSSQKKIRSDTIDRLERRDLIIEEEGNLDFAGGAFDRLYLKYYAASEGVIEDLRSYTTGFGEKPVNIIQFKIMDIAFDDFPEDYRCIAKFDMEYYPDSPGEFSKYWGMVIHRSGEITVESDEWTTILSFRIGEFQEKTPDSIWFRCNIDWMPHGFVAKVQVIDDSDKRDYDELLRQNVDSLKQDLRHLDYEILLENEYTWFQKGRDAFNDGDFEQAVEYIDEAIAVNPLFYEGWQSRGLTLQNLNRDDEALFSFEMALGIGGDNKEIMRKKGCILANKGLWNKAIECFENLTDQNPEYRVGWLDLSRAYLQTRQLEQSMEAFEEYQRQLNVSPGT
jgi:tetratricopeptide (TPR) repeat protein